MSRAINAAWIDRDHKVMSLMKRHPDLFLPAVRENFRGTSLEELEDVDPESIPAPDQE